jgi:hypothetical protein
MTEKRPQKGLGHGLCGRCVLGLHTFEFLFELIGPDIVEATQFVDLPQSEFGLAEIAQGGLGVVLCPILVGSRYTLIDFIQDHVDI